MKRYGWWILVAALLLSAPALSQEDNAAPRGEDRTAGDSREAAREARQRMIDRIRRATRLPRTAEDAREAGVPEEEVREVLDQGKRQRVPAAEMEEVLARETDAVHEYGNIDNFGGFVRSKLDEGLRGRELAEAIHREHAARGHGKYKPGKGQRRSGDGRGRGFGRGRIHDDERDDSRDRPARGGRGARVDDASSESEDREAARKGKAGKTRKQGDRKEGQ